MTPINGQAKTASLALAIILCSITLTYATGEGNYKNDTNTLPNIFEGAFTENGYKTSITVNPYVSGVYATENGYKTTLAINQEGIGALLVENNYRLEIIPEKTLSDTPDVAVTKIETPKQIVGQKYTALVKVTVANQEFNYETFFLTVYANATVIGTQTITLTETAPEIITFEWNTTTCAKGSYAISAYAWPIPGEADTSDNTLLKGPVKVVTPGDINADGIVNVVDAAGISAHWYPGPPLGPLGYDPNFDVNSDGVVNLVDASIASAYWTGPPKGPLAP